MADPRAGAVPWPDDPSVRRGQTRCSRCQADLGALPMGARFCHRCGQAVDPRRGPAAAPAADTGLLRFWSRLCHPGDNRPAARDARSLFSPALGESHSQMLLGYAGALFKLGSRYEAGRGAWRNVEEAARCYRKAAKLGDPSAVARLAPPPEPAGAGTPGLSPAGTIPALPLYDSESRAG